MPVAALVDVDGEVGPLPCVHGADLQLLVGIHHEGFHHKAEVLFGTFLPDPERDKDVFINEMLEGFTYLISLVTLMSTRPPASVLSLTLWALT